MLIPIDVKFPSSSAFFSAISWYKGMFRSADTLQIVDVILRVVFLLYLLFFLVVLFLLRETCDFSAILSCSSKTTQPSQLLSIFLALRCTTDVIFQTSRFGQTGAPNVNFWKTFVRKTIWDLEFWNICCKICCLPASPRIFEHLKNGMAFLRIFTLKRSPRIFGSPFSRWNFRKGEFWSL